MKPKFELIDPKIRENCSCAICRTTKSVKYKWISRNQKPIYLCNNCVARAYSETDLDLIEEELNMNYNELLDLYAKLETKYNQLTKECEELKHTIKITEETVNNKFDVEKDQIFLLSDQEYNKYRSAIPLIDCQWWLRTFSNDPNYATNVDNNGSTIGCADSYGNLIYTNCAVRPAIRYNRGLITSPIGSRFTWNGVTWVIIDTEKALAIAEMPIGFEKFDNESNNYATSHIRQWLLDWKSTHLINMGV